MHIEHEQCGHYCAMPTLEEVLELARDARENIECGRVNDAVWLLKAVEDNLVELHLQTHVAICLWNGVVERRLFELQTNQSLTRYGICRSG